MSPSSHPGEFKAVSKWHSLDRSRIRVAPRDEHVVRVEVEYKKSRSRDAVRVDVDVLDLKRTVAAARVPDLRSSATIRGADGTVSVRGYPSRAAFEIRSYDSGGQASMSLEAEPLQALSAFLESVAASHPLAPVNDDVSDDGSASVFETTGYNWSRPSLKVRPEGAWIVVEAAEDSAEVPHVEKVRVPFRSFAALVEVAGGDLPGSGYFDIQRGSLSAQYNRRCPLRLFVATDEVDGDTIIVELDIEQVQDLRRAVSAWRAMPPSD